jgi:hypothetical protein
MSPLVLCPETFCGPGRSLTTRTAILRPVPGVGQCWAAFFPRTQLLTQACELGGVGPAVMPHCERQIPPMSAPAPFPAFADVAKANVTSENIPKTITARIFPSLVNMQTYHTSLLQ